MERITETEYKPTIFDAVTVGADPEFFLERDGEYISAHDIVPGTKAQPHPLKGGVCIQADGTAVEFNIPPAKTKKDFCGSLEDALKQIRKIIPKEFTFKFVPAIRYPETYFSTLPSSATELGCSPDYSSLSGGRKTRPIAIAAKNKTLRAAGGHIHVGWGEGLSSEDPGHIFDCVTYVNSLDAVLRTYSKIWDKDTERANLYGANGAYRPKTYGVEYRGLSNAWLGYPKLWPWIWDMSDYVFNYLKTARHQISSTYMTTPFYDRKTGLYGESPLDSHTGAYKNNAPELFNKSLLYYAKLDAPKLTAPEFPLDWNE